MKILSKVCISALSLTALACVSNGVTSMASGDGVAPKENDAVFLGSFDASELGDFSEFATEAINVDELSEDELKELGIEVFDFENMTEEELEALGVEVIMMDESSTIEFNQLFDFEGGEEAINADALSAEELDELGIEIFDFDNMTEEEIKALGFEIIMMDESASVPLNEIDFEAEDIAIMLEN